MKVETIVIVEKQDLQALYKKLQEFVRSSRKTWTRTQYQVGGVVVEFRKD
jgi:hypothetical protein